MNQDRSTTITNSQLKEGYKQTEVGVIPEDWEVRSLADLAEIRSGIAKNSNALVSNPVLVHYLRVANVQDGFLDLSEMSQLQVNRDDIRRYAVLPGDMLMNEGGDLDKLGRGTLWSGEFNPCVHQNHVFVVRCGSKLVPSYLNSWTGTSASRRYFMLAGRQTTNLASINKTSLGQLPIALPPTKVEQEAIASTLSDIDALIESLDRLLTKKRQIKQGAMQELLHPYRNGQLKQGWIFQTIENLCIPSGLVRGPFGGALKKECFVTNGFKVYEQRNAIYKDFEIGSYFINLDKYQELKRFEVKTNDFIISCSGTIGKIYKIPKTAPPGIINQALLKLTIDSSKYSESYFCHYFSWKYFQSKIIDNTQGGAMKNLVGMPIFKATQMPLPEKIEEQIEIANVLSDMDAEIGSISAKLTKTRQLKQGMMHELLTGRIRLVDNTSIS